MKAQIKLKFCNTAGKEIICTRNLQVKQTSGKRSDALKCQTIETVLKMKNQQGQVAQLARLVRAW